MHRVDGKSQMQIASSKSVPTKDAPTKRIEDVSIENAAIKPSLNNQQQTNSFITRVTIALSLVFCLFLTSAQITNAQAQTNNKGQIIDRAHFFKQFRSQFYPIKEKEKYLIDRYERIFNYWDSQSHLKDLRWLAYIMATTYHETGRKIKAVRECFGKTDAASIACVTRLYRRGRIKRNYARIDPKTGKAYFGRGHVQLTWDYNYKRMGKELGMADKVYTNPDLALHPDTSVAIMAEGMIKGLFTGKRLSQYFNKTSTNWGGARRIVNGMDKYKLIGGYGRKFQATLRTIPSGKPTPDDCTSEKVPQNCLTKLNAKLAVLNSNYDLLDQNYKNIVSDNLTLKAKIKDQAQEIANLKAQSPGTNDALAALQDKFNTLEIRLNNTEAENNQTKLENAQLITKTKELQTKLDEAITKGPGAENSELLKKRLEQVEQQFQTLTQKLTKVEQDQQRLDALNTTLTQKQTKINDQLQDIEISRNALQTREQNLLSDLDLLKQQENTLKETELKLSATEARLLRYENDLREEKRIFEEYKSKSWYKRMWDNVSSTWRNE